MSWSGPNNNFQPPFGRPGPGGAQSFWNFVHSFDPNARAGAGVDHAGFPFHNAEFGFGNGPSGWGGYGGWGDPRHRGFGHRRGGRCGNHEPEEAMRDAEETMRDGEEVEASDKEKDDTPDTMRDAPEEGAPEHGGPHGGPGRRGRGGRFGRGPPGGDHWRHSRHHHGPHGHHGPRGPHPPPPPPFGAAPPPPPPPPYTQPGNFDFPSFLQQFAGHPFAQNIRDWATRMGFIGADGAAPGGPDFGGPDFGGPAPNDDSNFTPPVDVFATERAYVLHYALPGAKKEDIGVDWDADKGELRVAGVVYRPGDEDFLATMASSERRVGMFTRSVPLPPAGAEREEIDALSITAKMEDGVLIVTVPKLEKEWTEIHKVDIE